MKSAVNNPCFICGGTESEIVFTKKYPEVDYPGSFQMNRCLNCGLLFNSPRLSEEGIGKLYDNNYYFFHRREGVEFKRMIPMYQKTVGLIEPEIPGSKILEIGSAKGYFLAVLKKMGWDGFGVEISAAATKFAREKLGVSCYTGTLENYAEQEESEEYPVVLAFDLLEHVTNPADFMLKLNKVTQTGGTIVIMTPNGGAANIQSLQSAWSGFNPFHIFIFTRENISQLLKKHGFEIQRIFSYNNTKKTLDSLPEQNSGSFSGIAKLALKKLKLINLIKNMRLKIWQYQDAKLRDEYLNQSFSEIKKQGDYFSTPDSRAELADSCEGDNLVIIARKL